MLLVINVKDRRKKTKLSYCNIMLLKINLKFIKIVAHWDGKKIKIKHGVRSGAHMKSCIA